MVTIEQFHRRLNRGAGFEKYDYEEAATLHAFATRFARVVAEMDVLYGVESERKHCNVIHLSHDLGQCAYGDGATTQAPGYPVYPRLK